MKGVARSRRRRGTLLVECSIVYTVALLLILGTIVLGLGIFRYQQVAWLAREGARWAAVHGSTYQQEQGASAPTSANVMTSAITPRLVLLAAADLTCTLTMTSGRATVKLVYSWTPEAFLSPITFTSTSSLPITY